MKHNISLIEIGILNVKVYYMNLFHSQPGSCENNDRVTFNQVSGSVQRFRTKFQQSNCLRAYKSISNTIKQIEVFLMNFAY